MPSKNNLIIIGIILVIGVFLITRQTAELVTYSTIPDGVSNLTIPQGVGMGNIRQIEGFPVPADYLFGINNLYKRCFCPSGDTAQCGRVGGWTATTSCDPVYSPGFIKVGNILSGWAPPSFYWKFDNAVCFNKGSQTCSSNTIANVNIGSYPLSPGGYVCPSASAIYNDYLSKLPPDNSLFDFTFVGAPTGGVLLIGGTDCGTGSISVNDLFVKNNVFNPTKKVPFIFEGTTPKITITLNPNEDVRNSMSVMDGVVFAWIESQLSTPGGLSAEAIRLFGKSIDLIDLSRLEKISNSKQDFEFILSKEGPLPVGRYDFYSIFAYREVQTFYAITDIIHIPFLVNPKPIWQVTDPGSLCTSGYKPQYTSEFSTGVCKPQTGLEKPLGPAGCVCIRDDIDQFSCIQLGCPVTVNFTYSCGSDEFCSETITRAADCRCDDSTSTDACQSRQCGSNLLCEPTSGVCFNTVLKLELFQCKIPSDCYDPKCKDGQGNPVIAACTTNQCTYSGTCQPQLSGCPQRSCPVGFECTTTSGSDGLCVKETVITQYINITVNQTNAGGEIIKPPKKPFNINTIIIIATGLIVIYFMFFKKKKKIL